MANLRFAGLLILVSLSAASAAVARPVAPSFMPEGDLADAPAGFIDMCVREPGLCLIGQSPDAAPPRMAYPIALSDGTRLEPTGATLDQRTPRVVQPRAETPVHVDNGGAASGDLRQLAKSVNSTVNRHVTQRTDMAAMGVGEYWQRLPAQQPVGDCEDIAIEKRIRLTEAGFPVDRMFYGVAFVRGKGLHTVLIVRMDDGDYVLDSMTPHILRWEKTHYIWLRKQVPGSPLEWERVDRLGTKANFAATSDRRTSEPAS